MAKRPLKPDEKRAWARVAKTVRARPEQTPPEMPPLDGLTAPDTRVPSTGHHLARASYPIIPSERQKVTFKVPSSPLANRGKERKVKRGQLPISATLDLHGHTQASAQSRLTSFLERERRAGSGCVLVITGKGRLGDGILRRRLLDWLGTTQARTLVSGYAQAHQKHGGSGAWYVFLRK